MRVKLETSDCNDDLTTENQTEPLRTRENQTEPLRTRENQTEPDRTHDPHPLLQSLIMSTDTALPLYLPQEEFVYRSRTFSPALTFPPSSCVDTSRPEDTAASCGHAGNAKKKVWFADDRGLSLTKVKVFSQFNDPIDIPANIQEMLSASLSLTAEEDKLVLDFAQPSSDYLLFHQRLERKLVSLERCVLKDRTLTGTVKVRNTSFEKRVKLRVTFDTWTSHTDVDCVYTEDTYPGSHSDTFSFQVALPEALLPHQHVEFAVCYEADGCKFWDSNHGNNYRIVWSSMKTSRRHTGSRDFGIHFDPYAGPTCSHGIFPDWPSYAGYENIGPYY